MKSRHSEKLMQFQTNEDGGSPSMVEGFNYLNGSPVSIRIKDGKISEITSIDNLSDPSANPVYVAPGFIDHQVNGYLSHSFTSENLSLQHVRKITHNFWQQGITTYLPTLTSHSFELLLKNFTALGKIIQDDELNMSIPGFHLEGPYISPVSGYRGAHEEKWIRRPNWDEFLKWHRASGEKILEVTIAPELEGAMDFIKKCREQNIIVALGHHNSTAAIIREAADVGASAITHLGNGCANLIHRHDNPIWPQLADDRLTASLIVDGFHLTPEEVQVFYKVKGPERTVLVSDVSSLAGMPPGIYESYGREVTMTPEGKIVMPSQNVLAAASFLITKGIENTISFTQCTLPEAVHLATRNPARLLGLEDRGELVPGKRADMVWFEVWHNKLKIRKTMVGGKIVFCA